VLVIIALVLSVFALVIAWPKSTRANPMVILQSSFNLLGTYHNSTTNNYINTYSFVVTNTGPFTIYNVTLDLILCSRNSSSSDYYTYPFTNETVIYVHSWPYICNYDPNAIYTQYTCETEYNTTMNLDLSVTCYSVAYGYLLPLNP
jgi:hypothetical protein